MRQKQLQIHGKKIDANFCIGVENALGFMFTFSQERAKVLCFPSERRISLHMFFVFFPLHAIFLDSRKRVVDYVLLRPFTFYSSKKRAKYVVEIPLSLFRGQVKRDEKIKFIS